MSVSDPVSVNRTVQSHNLCLIQAFMWSCWWSRSAQICGGELDGSAADDANTNGDTASVMHVCFK